MEASNDDYNYLPYSDRGVRIFTKDCKPNIKLFIADFKATEFGAKLVSEGLAYGTNLDEILGAAWDRFGHEDVSMTEYVHAAKSLYMLGELKKKSEPVAQAPQPKELSASQLAWSEMRQYTNNHSVADCKARSRTDETYRKFLHTNLERETRETPRLELQPLNLNAPATKRDVPDDVVAYAIRYRTMSSEAVRKELTPGINPLGPAAAAEAKRLLDACCAAGLI